MSLIEQQEPITVERLKVTNPPIPEGGGRLVGPAGELAQIINGESMRFVAYIEFKAGLPRGNHLHRLKTEILYVICGELTAAYYSTVTSANERLTLKAGDRVRVPPNWAHAYFSDNGALAVEMSPNQYDPSDTYPYLLIS